jgi:hypothetical protein
MLCAELKMKLVRITPLLLLLLLLVSGFGVPINGGSRRNFVLVNTSDVCLLSLLHSIHLMMLPYSIHS